MPDDDPVAALVRDLIRHYGRQATISFGNDDWRERGFIGMRVEARFGINVQIDSPTDHWIILEPSRVIKIPRTPTEPDYQI